ncbi:MAG: hypothetical protein ABIG39_06080 [Candidatus Micrarchaeota archaeon]
MKPHVFILAVVLSFLAGCTGQEKLCEYNEPYDVVETYTEQVPYGIKECKNVTMSKETGVVCENRTSEETHYEESCTRRIYQHKALTSKPDVYCIVGNPFMCSDGTITCSYWVKNLEKIGGNWTAEMTITNRVEGKEVHFDAQTIGIHPGTEASFDFTHNIGDSTDTSKWACTATVISPVIEACSTIPKTRTIVQEECTPIFTDVFEEQCHNVTKYISEERQRTIQENRAVRRPC